MLLRPIPSTNELLPAIGLGTWIQFDIDDSNPEREQLKDVLRKMLEAGGTLIDSSPMYGRSENAVGTLTQEIKLADKFFYATKVWTSGEQNGIIQMKESFMKMQRKKIDLMQIHNLTDWRTQLKTLRRWKSEGMIRYIGITHYTVSAHEQLEQVIRSEEIDFVQFNYSIQTRNAEKSLLPLAQDKGVAVLINEPFEKVSLFKKVKNEKLPEWAKEYSINSWAQFFLKYILSHPAVTCVIPGTSQVKNIIDNMKAGEGILPDDETRKWMVKWVNK